MEKRKNLSASLEKFEDKFEEDFSTTDFSKVEAKPKPILIAFGKDSKNLNSTQTLALPQELFSQLCVAAQERGISPQKMIEKIFSEKIAEYLPLTKK